MYSLPHTITKRNGKPEAFSLDKIKNAILKAAAATGTSLSATQMEGLIRRLLFTDNMSVEEIQNQVEMELMKSSRKDVARAYISYRNQRSVARKAKTRDVFLEIINVKNNDITRENANMNADTPAGMMMKFSSETTKPFVDDYLLSEESREAVRQNRLHIHD